MQPNSQFIGSRLTQFLATGSTVLWGQINHLMADIHLLSLELDEKINLDQERRFKDDIEIAHSLRTQIIHYQSICTKAVDLLYQPTEVKEDEVNVSFLIKNAIESAENHIADLSKFITMHIDEQMVFRTYPFLVTGISQLLIWIQLIAPSSHFLISATETEAEVILILSVDKDLALSKLARVYEDVCAFSKLTAEFVVSILGGSFNWKRDQLIPDESELVIRLPKQPIQSSE